METLWQDVRYGARQLARNPGFTAVAVLTLALGIGATTAMFTVVNSVLLNALPYKDPERIAIIWNDLVRTKMHRLESSGPEFLDISGEGKVFEQVAGFYSPFYVNLTEAGEPVRLRAAIASAGLFPLLGVDAMVGRTYLPEEDAPDNLNFAVLSYGFWQRHFGGSGDILGKAITLDGDKIVMLGVMPADFRFPDAGVDLWLPLGLNPSEPGNRRNRWLRVVGRIKPGLSLEHARAGLELLEQQLKGKYPQDYGPMGWEMSLVPLHQDLVRNVRTSFLVMLGAVSLVLLVACANVGNLLLARATLREGEIAVRAALGASRSRLIRQLLTESILLSLLGGVMGLPLALGAIRALALLRPEIPLLEEIGPDGTVFAFAFATAALTGVVFGLVPAFQATRPDLSSAVKQRDRGGGEQGSRHRLRGLLVVSEVALALVLVIGAGLMMKSFLLVQQIDPGFNARNLLTMEVRLPYNRSHPESLAYFREILRRLRSLPGVEAVGGTSHLPLSGSENMTSFIVEGNPVEAGDEFPSGDPRVVTPGYLSTMKIPLLKGRYLQESDGEEGLEVVVIDDELQQRYWPGQDPIGRRMKRGSTGEGSWLTVVGVVGHVKYSGLEVESRGQFYLPHAQTPSRFMHVVLRTSSDPASLAAAARDTIWQVDRNQPVTNISTMDRVIVESFSQRRFSTFLFGCFAAVALLLAVIGVYGVMSYSVSQRNREIGIRIALGARSGDILRLVIVHGLVLTGIGIAVGLGGALALTRFLASLLFGVASTDPVTYAAVSALLVLVALLACWIPARRATRVDPMVALRYE